MWVSSLFWKSEKCWSWEEMFTLGGSETEWNFADSVSFYSHSGVFKQKWCKTSSIYLYLGLPLVRSKLIAPKYSSQPFFTCTTVCPIIIAVMGAASTHKPTGSIDEYSLFEQGGGRGVAWFHWLLMFTPVILSVYFMWHQKCTVVLMLSHHRIYRQL